MKNKNGYKDFPLHPELYDLVVDFKNRSDRDFYVNMCLDAAGKVLELGCGTGRVLIPAAEAGCQITGLDLSEYMLSRCQEKLEQTAKDVQTRARLIRGDMADFQIDDIFDMTIFPFHVFQHLISVDKQLACLRKINSHLAMSGKLILDVFAVNLEKLLGVKINEEFEYTPQSGLSDGRLLQSTHRITAVHRIEQFSDVEMIYYLTDTKGNTERLVHSFPFRYFFRYEIEHLLGRCGFELIDIYGNFEKSSFTDDSPEMIFVARKTKEID
jgi:SAM-dependent methyltransferase